MVCLLRVMGMLCLACHLRVMGMLCLVCLRVMGMLCMVCHLRVMGMLCLVCLRVMGMLCLVMGHSPLGPRMGGVWVGCPPFLSWVLFMVGQSLAHMLSLCRLAGLPPVWGLV